MEVSWRTFAWPDGASLPTITVSEHSSWSLFDDVASHLAGSMGELWSARLDDIDQRWWDLKVGDGKITLHLDHYLGISIYADRGGGEPLEASRALLDAAFRALLDL